MASRMDVLRNVADEYGYDDVMTMLQTASFDSVCPAVCLRCGATMDLEPDGRCTCEECGGPVKSVLLIAGLI